MFSNIWNWIKDLFREKEPTRPHEPIDPVKDPSGELSMSERVYAALAQHNGMKEVRGSGNNPDIVNMFNVVTGRDYPDSTPWCALYMCYCLIQSGFKNFNTLLARDFMKVGREVDLEDAVRGDIAVFKRGNSSWKGHVSGFIKVDGDRILCLGGNQSDSVNLQWYSLHDLLSIRRMRKEDLSEVRDIPSRPNIPDHAATSWGNDFFSEAEMKEIKKMIDERLSVLNPKDVYKFNKYYSDLTINARTDFWLVLLSAMAKKESNHDPSRAYKESFRDTRGNYIISRGLFQLSPESVNGYNKFASHFPKVTSSTLHDKMVNTRWAIVILSRWVKKDGVIYSESDPWKGGARYWSVLRNNDRTEFIIEDCLKRYS